MLTQSTHARRLLLSGARFLAVIATAGLALSGPVPAGAAGGYKQKSQTTSSGNTAARWDATARKAA